MSAASVRTDARLWSTFDGPVEKILCVLAVASAVKTPLGIPLYFNSTLLALGAFWLVVRPSMPGVLLWMVGLVGLGCLAALQLGVMPDSGPRLLQLLLILLATALISRLDPDLLGRYLALLVPLFVLILVTEPLLPEPLYLSRKVFGIDVSRQAGLQGEPNYNAMLYGVVGMILAQHPPRWLCIPPFLLALPSLSRGLMAAIVGWFGTKVLGRSATWLVPLGVLVLCSQPFIVMAVDGAIDVGQRHELNRLSSDRYMIWVAYAEAGASSPLGVGYFQGETVITEFAGVPSTHAGRQAHSIFLQVFAEFGWAGYLLFVGFLVHLTRIVIRFAPGQLPLLVFILTGYAFLNGLSDWAFWVPLGYVLARAREAEQLAAPR